MAQSGRVAELTESRVCIPPGLLSPGCCARLVLKMVMLIDERSFGPRVPAWGVTQEFSVTRDTHFKGHLSTLALVSASFPGDSLLPVGQSVAAGPGQDRTGLV